MHNLQRYLPHQSEPWLLLAVLLFSSLLLSSIVGAAPAQSTPEQALTNYYLAINSQDCERAAALRPGYRIDLCRVTLTHLQGVKLLLQKDQRAALTISVDIQRCSRPRSQASKDSCASASRKQFFGVVGLRECNGNWVIMGNTFRRIADTDAQQNFAGRLVQGKYDAGSSCPIQQQESVAVQSQISSQPNIPQRIVPVHGSQALLRFLWPSVVLAASSDKDQTILDSVYAINPPILPATARNWQFSQPQPALKVIRSVELPKKKRAIALTFNLIERSGERGGYDVAIVNLLREQRVAATFFASGRWMQSHPERSKQLMVDPLFELGSMGWEHRNFATAKPQSIIQDLLLAEAVYRNLYGSIKRRLRDLAVARDLEYLQKELALSVPIPRLVRLPYGRCDAKQKVLQMVASLDVRVVQWNLIMNDVAQNVDTQQMLAQIKIDLERSGSGTIMVGHADGRGLYTAEVLRELLLYLRDKKYELLTVSQLLGRGQPQMVSTCYEHDPGDNAVYDQVFLTPTPSGNH